MSAYPSFVRNQTKITGTLDEDLQVSKPALRRTRRGITQSPNNVQKSYAMTSSLDQTGR